MQWVENVRLIKKVLLIKKNPFDWIALLDNKRLENSILTSSILFLILLIEWAVREESVAIPNSLDTPQFGTELFCAFSELKKDMHI